MIAAVRSTFFRLALVVAVVAAWVPSAAGQFAFPGEDGNPVHVEVSGPATPVAPGGEFDVVVAVRIDPPYHIYTDDSEGDEYLIRTRVEPLVDGEAVAAGDDVGPHFTYRDTRYPDDEKDLYMSGLDETFQVWEGRFEIRSRFAVADDAAEGRTDLPVRVTYQACDDRGCKLPQFPEFTVPVTVSREGAAQVGGGDDSSLDERIENALEAGDLWLFLGLAVLEGFVSLLTPCVFPMIPITVSFFAKRGESGGGGTRYALAYGLGIVATYTGFGMAMALVFGASSVQGVATNPWMNIAIGALFVFFGVSLLGFFDLQPPAFLVKRASGGGASAPGYAPVFVMGFVFTVTAFTCTVPIVGALLAQLTSTGEPAFMVAGMLAYSAAFALPFVLLALFPGALNALPGAGGWMVTVKVMLGFIEIIAALKFFSTADLVWGKEWLTRPVMLVMIMAVVAAMALYVFGAFRLPHDIPGKRARLPRTVVGLGLIALLIYLGLGLGGRLLDGWTESYLPARAYGADGRHADPIPWLDDLDAGLAVARESGLNVFVDFTGRSCQNCRLVEKTIFSEEEFVVAIGQVVPVRLYTDRRDEPHRAGDLRNQQIMMNSYESVTLPLYVLLEPDGSVIHKMGYSPGLDLESFIAFLEAK